MYSTPGPPLVVGDPLPYSSSVIIIGQLIDVFVIILFIDVILSWVMRPHQFPLNYTRQLTEPMYAPIRQIIDPQKMGGLDLSPLVWIFGLQILGNMLGV